MAHNCNSKQDKVRYYRQALIINSIVWLLQILVLLFFANSLTLKGDMFHGFADILILFATHHVFKSELQNFTGNHHTKKNVLVMVAVLLLWFSAGDLTYEAVQRIASPVDFPGWPVAIVSLLSSIGNFTSHKIIGKVEKCEHDKLHKINVAHLITDAVISLCVFISALGKILYDTPAVDAWLSFPVALWMFILGWNIITGKGHH